MFIASGNKGMILVGYADLKEMGVPYTQTHLYRLVKAGEFPKPVKLGNAPNARIAWKRAEILEWIDSRVQARDRSES
jgi:predicted DNA-binding transcriptional regulator AlpA